MSATELRRIVERIVAGDRYVRGALGALPGLSAVDAWAAVASAFGATPDQPFVDAASTVAGARLAGARIAAVAGAGGRIAFAVATPASLLPLFLSAAELARACGGDVADLPDAGPVRADGRTDRAIRWLGGVATVTDGGSLCATRDGEAAREWLFVIPRPALVVAEPPFAEVAWEAGLEVVVLASLDRAALAIAAACGDRCTLVPLRTDRAPAAYDTVVACLHQGATPQV